MNKGRRAVIAFGIAATAALLAIAPALGATPQQIYRDAADNGRLDGNYTAADINRAVRSAQVQGYGSPIVKITIKHGPSGNKTSGGNLAAEKMHGGGTTPVPPRGNNLPFTGAELGLFTVVGLALVASGILLRLTGRKRSG